jgi:hypothetical protein
MTGCYACAFALSAGAVEVAAQVRDIGNRKQLFIDTRFIAEAQNIRLTPNPPCKRDPVEAGPLLQLPENRNLDFGAVFIDPVAPPEQRYKRLRLRGKMREKDTAGLYIATSPDRKAWTEIPEPVFRYWPDGENSMMYDPRIGRYVAYFRQWVRRSEGTYHDAPIPPLRTVGRLEVDDPLKPWPCPPTDNPFHLWGPNNLPTPGPEFETVLACDENDPPECDFYDHGIVRYPWADDVYLAFPVLYRHFPDPPDKRLNDGLCDVQLAVSRDGVNWTRYRVPYIGLGTEGAPDAGVIYCSRSMLRNGDEIYQYYSAAPKSHGTGFNTEGNPSSHGMVVQRLDGFVSADAPYEGGELTTPPVIFAGNQLQLNIDCSAAGDARVEIQDTQGRPIEGFALDQADTIRGNSLRKTVTWKGQTDVSHLAGTPIRLHIAMRAAKLYAFQFAAYDTNGEPE